MTVYIVTRIYSTLGDRFSRVVAVTGSLRKCSKVIKEDVGPENAKKIGTYLWTDLDHPEVHYEIGRWEVI